MWGFGRMMMKIIDRVLHLRKGWTIAVPIARYKDPTFFFFFFFLRPWITLCFLIQCTHNNGAAAGDVNYWILWMRAFTLWGFFWEGWACFLCLLYMGFWFCVYWVWGLIDGIGYGTLVTCLFFFFNLIHENGLDFLWVWNFGLGMLHAWFFFYWLLLV